MANKRLKKKFGRRRNGEGSVSMRKDGIYQASLMVSGKRIYEYSDNEGEAWDRLENMREKARSGVSLTDGDISVVEGTKSYIKRYEAPFVRPSTLKNYQGYLEKHICNSRLGKQKMSKTVADDVQNFINELSRMGLSGKTVINIVGFLDSVFAQAVRNRLITYNPCEGVRLPKKKTKERPLISEEEYSKLIAAAEEQTMSTAIAILGEGLRIGELLALQWKDLIEIDDVTVLTVSKSLKREYLFDAEQEKAKGTKTEIRLSEPKTDSSVRQVPVIPRVLIELEKLKAEQQRIAKELGIKFTDDLFIIGVVGKNGFGYTTQDKFRKKFAICVERAGLPKEVTPHALRRYASSTLIRHGASPVAVAKLLGHSNSTTTLNYYSRENLRGTLDAVMLLEE